MSFPNDIKGCMKDCILSVLWPKQDIYTFLGDHGCTSADLKVIAQFKDEGMTRSKMIDLMFEHLSSLPTGGLGPFRAMLQSLLNWSRFDPYYFDNLKKLDRSKAQKCLDHLRQLQELRDAKIISDREKRETAEAAKQQPQISLSELRDEFLGLHSGKTTPPCVRIEVASPLNICVNLWGKRERDHDHQIFRRIQVEHYCQTTATA